MKNFKITTKIQEILANESQNNVIFGILSFIFGVYFSIVFYENLNNFKIAISVILLFISLFLFLINKKENLYKFLIFGLFASFFCGFSFSYFHQKIFNNYEKITGKIFVDIEGEVSEIKEFYNKQNHQNGLNLIVKNPILTKSNYAQSQAKKPKKIQKEKKLSKKYIQENFENVSEFIDIDDEFLIKKQNYQNVEWKQENGKYFYEKPPKKVRVFLTKNYEKNKENLKIGDKIYFKAILMPIKNNQIFNNFDFAFYNFSMQIGASGYAISDLEIISKNEKISNFNIFFKNLRKKVQDSINLNALPNQAGVINALLTGDRKKIDEKNMQNIRNSGLAHLIAISGLHLTLSATIFFFIARFLLAQNYYLTLNFDIKKIAAISAILGSFIYLQIAGAPISAVRAFIMVFLAMIAIFFDRKNDLLRTIFFAALLLILINPYNMFMVSFQLSFAAVLGIVAFHDIWTNFYDKYFKKNNREISKIHKFFKYFLEMILISLMAQIATLPFLSFHFSEFAIYGTLSNLIAIPLTSLIIMPLGFLSLFLMPFMAEKFTLILMSHFVSIILKTAEFVANIKNANLSSLYFSKSALTIAIFGGLIFLIFKNKYFKILGIIIFFSSFLLLKNKEKPNIIIDNNASFFALYDQENGLIFSKKVRESKKIKELLKAFNQEKINSFADFSLQKLENKGINCFIEFCEINLEKYFNQENLKIKNIIILQKRTKIEDICNKNYDLLINLTKKYQIPKCFKAKKIDNSDILEKGAHLIFLNKKEPIEIND